MGEEITNAWDKKTETKTEYEGSNQTLEILKDDVLEIKAGKYVEKKTFDDMPAGKKVECQIVVNFTIVDL